MWSLKGTATRLTTSGAVSYGTAALGVPTAGYPQLGSWITG